MIKIGIQELVEKLLIRVGIENELMTINSKGFLIPASPLIVNEIIEDILNRRVDTSFLKRYIYGIQWEPHPAQIEVVTQPLYYHTIEDAIRLAWRYLASVAQRRKINIYAGSVHPVQSNPFPINGTHISASLVSQKRNIMPRKFLVYVHNNIRRYIPELIALTANSPIIAGEPSGYASSRLFYSRVLKPSGYATIKRSKTTIIPREKRALLKYAFVFSTDKKYEHKVVAHRVGLRFLDVTPRGPYTNIIEDNWSSPKVSRIEVRFLDNPSTIDYLIDIVNIILGISLEAIHMLHLKERIKEPKYLNENRARAIKDGIDAVFIVENGKEIPAKECVLNMLESIYPYLDALGVKLRTSLARGIPELKYFGLPKITSDNEDILEKIRLGKLFMEIQLSDYREIISFSGERILAWKKHFFGIVFPEYKMEWVRNNENVVARYTRIHSSFWLLTNKGYIRLEPNDKVLSAKTAIGRLIQIFSRMLEKTYLTQKTVIPQLQ